MGLTQLQIHNDASTATNIFALETFLGRHYDRCVLWDRGCCSEGTIDTSTDWRVCAFAVAQVAFVLLQSTPEVRRAFAIGFVAALFPLGFLAVGRGGAPFILAAVGAKSTNPMLPFFETNVGATLVAIVIAVIAGMFVASGRMLQRRRIALVATTVFLILVWMFLWDVAVQLRNEKHLSPQSGAATPGADFSSHCQIV